jgi:hypothetical protein
MLLENRLNNLKDKTLEYVKEHHIKHVVFSRESVSKSKKLLNQLSQVGVKIYAVEYELDSVFGMYADYWNYKAN